MPNLKRIGRKRGHKNTQQVHTLLNPTTKEKYTFPLYKDSEIGLSEKQFVDNLFLVQNDDDFQTTLTVYENAQDDCKKDHELA